MKKIVSLLLVTCIATALLLSGCDTGSTTSADDTMTITDCLGRSVNVPINAERFVAIGPGCLRLYCYVGDVDQIVGVEQTEITSTSRPYAIVNGETFAELPVVGPGGPRNAPDAEAILEATPDVIFSTYNSDSSTVDDLASKTNIPVVALDYGDTEVFDPIVDKSLELIGEITGNEERAAEVIQFFVDIKTDLAVRTSGIPFLEKPVAYYGAQSSRGTHGIESTSGDYSLFTALNIRNVVGEAGIGAYVMLDKEQLLDWQPEIIILDGGGLANVREDYNSTPEFYNGLDAFKNDKVYMQLPYNSYWTNIDTALVDAYYIGSIIYPNKFSDVDVIAKANEIYNKLLGEEIYAEVAALYYGGFQKLSFD